MGRGVRISDLMNTSGVKFGTSGARGLVADMNDRVCYAYTTGFIQHLEEIGDLGKNGERIAIAGDLRPSTSRIMAAAVRAVRDRGYAPVNCGTIPSPAVAYYGLLEKIPAIMVTGSHIPDDRNGIKYNKVAGEILKEDEAAMKEQTVELPDIFQQNGMFTVSQTTGAVEDAAARAYVERYTKVFDSRTLSGMKIGLYEHSSVGRDLVFEVLTALGAEVTRLGRSDIFVPVDTEAIRPEDVELAANWAKQHSFHSIVSTDGDSDRPLVSDEHGKWIRGDIAGVLTAHFLKAEAVVTPVSSNTALEKCGAFRRVLRTRIGSPYVVAAMNQALEEGAKTVVGYEANGGFLTASPFAIGRDALLPLPTRDALLVHLSILIAAKQKGQTISALTASLPERYTASDRIKEFPRELSLEKIGALSSGGKSAIEATFPKMGPVKSTDETDGLRIEFASGDIVHLRPSGNAPELRCYTESDSEDNALSLNRHAIALMEHWR